MLKTFIPHEKLFLLFIQYNSPDDSLMRMYNPEEALFLASGNELM